MSRTGVDWSPEEMRRLGYAVVDAVVDRQVELPTLAPWVGGSRSELEPLLREGCPEEGRDPDQILSRALSTILPPAGRIDHPRFMAFVPASPVWPSILGDWLATGFNIFQGTWLESAAPSQTELVVLDWFREWLGMPEGAGGLFTSGGSAANLTATVAARERAGNPGRPTGYISDQAHSSVARAWKIAGLPDEGLRKLPAGRDLRLDPALVERRIEEDRAAGRHPLMVVGNGGATNTGVVDPLDGLGEVARRHGVWFHVDAAYGGFAVLTPRGRQALHGIDAADSVTLDPHKWLFQTYEAGCLMVRDPDDLTRAFRVLPEYLQDTELGMEHVNFGDRGIQLTRSFRALKVWMTVQMCGRRVLEELVDEAITLAERAGEWIQASPHLELLADPGLSIVCFRAAEGDDDWNRAIQDTVVSEGVAMMSSTRLRGRFSLRLCILNHRTAWADVEATLARIEALAAGGPA